MPIALTNDVAKQLVEFCKQGKNLEAINQLYSDDIVSVEAVTMPGHEKTLKGIDAIRGKTQWWYENHEVHGGEVLGPFPHDDRFAVYFKFDVTPKQTGKRMTMEEVGIFTVEKGKIIKEEFFYDMDC